MESERGDAPSPSEARDTLSALDRDRTALSARIVTPWWYHPALGLITATLVFSQALPALLASVLVVAAIVCIPVLVLAYRRAYGVTVTTPAGPRSTRMLFALMAVLVVALVTALLIRIAEQPAVWALLPATAAFALAVVLGRRYDRLYREDLVADDGGQRR